TLDGSRYYLVLEILCSFFAMTPCIFALAAGIFVHIRLREDVVDAPRPAKTWFRFFTPQWWGLCHIVDPIQARRVAVLSTILAVIILLVIIFLLLILMIVFGLLVGLRYGVQGVAESYDRVAVVSNIGDITADLQYIITSSVTAWDTWIEVCKTLQQNTTNDDQQAQNSTQNDQGDKPKTASTKETRLRRGMLQQDLIFPPPCSVVDPDYPPGFDPGDITVPPGVDPGANYPPGVDPGDITVPPGIDPGAYYPLCHDPETSRCHLAPTQELTIRPGFDPETSLGATWRRPRS
ncbi:hypothetical protein CYMTET_53309, partial [Cymbomonas tetramitiformis]